MPDMLSSSPFATPTEPRYKTWLIGAGYVLLGLLCMGATATQATKATGEVAHKGTLTVESCTVRHVSGRHGGDKTMCVGTFRPGRGPAVRDETELEGDHIPGEHVRVYREDYEYHLISWRSFWGWLAFFFLSVLAVCRGATTALSGVHARTVDEFTVVRSLMERHPGAPYVAALRWAGAGGLLLCFVFALVSH